jgi:pimeloyl-ACP methyl ester carboxylesterase
MDEPSPVAPIRRRTFVEGLMLGCGGALLGGAAASAQTPAGETPKPSPERPAGSKRDRKRRPFVLVHGAWHGGWCWRMVAQRLRAAGHQVFTPTLTGLGERAHLLTPQTDLETHITDITNLIITEELEEVVLVGHSYGGIVITGVADRLPEALAHVVFLDALLIKPGDSALSVQSPEFADSIRKLQAAGNLAGNPPPAKILGIPEGDPLAAWVERRMTPQPLATLTQPLILKRGGADSLPRVYIECVRPGLFGEVNPFAQRARAEPGWTVATLETGHDAMVTAPEALTRLLVQVG